MNLMYAIPYSLCIRIPRSQVTAKSEPIGMSKYLSNQLGPRIIYSFR